MYIVVYFRSNGVPVEGLTPIVCVSDVALSSEVVSDENMVEVGNGFYKYDFVDYSTDRDYVVVCDGGETLTGYERYLMSCIESPETDTTSIQKVMFTMPKA